MKFYIIDDLKAPKMKRKWCDAVEVDRKNGEAERCPVCGRYISSFEWLEPRKMRLTSTNYPDRISWWLNDSFIVSERFVGAYTAEGLSGIESFTPVEVVKVGHRKDTSIPIPKYFYAKIPYVMCVRVDPQNTIIHGQKYDWSCELCNPFGTTCDHIEKLALDASKWDGTDVMRVYARGYIFSERFYEFISRNNFTNFNLVPVDEYSWM